LISAEKNNAIADLARKISHEIKNPLTPMLLSSEFLESQLEDEDLKNSVVSIKRQIFLIQNLVNEFSSYARLPKPKIVKLNISDISNIYIDEYKKNYSNIILIAKSKTISFIILTNPILILFLITSLKIQLRPSKIPKTHKLKCYYP
jgi:nitrogen fixation/metabolism regulation signal transduction histidine kinase